MDYKNYKNNVENQRSLLQEHLNDINTVVSAKLGIKINLEIEEKTDYRKQTIFNLIDNRNLKSQCGIMENVFKNVYIETFGMWWDEDGVCFELDFRYEYIDGGRNGAHFCTMQIKNNLIKMQ